MSEEEGDERYKGKVSLSWIKKSARGRTRLVRLSEGSRWDVRGAHLRHDRGVHVGVDGVIGVNLRRRRGRRVVGRAVVRSLPGEARTDRIWSGKGAGFLGAREARGMAGIRGDVHVRCHANGHRRGGFNGLWFRRLTSSRRACLPGRRRPSSRPSPWTLSTLASTRS